MQKIVIAMLCLLSLTATTALAEHKLLITDVLASRQFEVETDFSYGHNSVDTTHKIQTFDPNWGTPSGYVDRPGIQTRNIVRSAYSIGIGIGYGVQLNAAIPYVFVDNIKQQDNESGPWLSRQNYYGKQDGVGDLTLGVKYGLYENRANGLSVVTGLDVKLYTAESSKAGTGSNDIAPYVAASTVVNGDLKPYASYRAIFRDNGSSDAHVISAGAEYEINKLFSLTPRVSATFRTDSDWSKAYNTYAFGLSSYVHILPNLYLIPHLEGSISSSSKTKVNYMDYGTSKYFNAGLGLYYLFN